MGSTQPKLRAVSIRSISIQVLSMEQGKNPLAVRRWSRPWDASVARTSGVRRNFDFWAIRLVPLGSHVGRTLGRYRFHRIPVFSLAKKAATRRSKQHQTVDVFVQCGLRRFPHEVLRWVDLGLKVTASFDRSESYTRIIDGQVRCITPDFKPKDLQVAWNVQFITVFVPAWMIPPYTTACAGKASKILTPPAQ